MNKQNSSDNRDPQLCVKCGDSKADSNGWCMTGRPYIANMSDSSKHVICGCRCEFPPPQDSQVAPERIWLSPSSFIYKTQPAPAYIYYEQTHESGDIEFVRADTVAPSQDVRIAEIDPVNTYPTVIEAVQLLEAAGMGTEGKPNTLLDMVKEALAKIPAVDEAIAAVKSDTWDEAIRITLGTSETNYDFRGNTDKPSSVFKYNVVDSLEAAKAQSLRKEQK